MRKTIITIFILSTFLTPAFSSKPDCKSENRRATGSVPPAYQFMNTSRNSIYPEWGYYMVQSTGFSVLTNPNLSREIWNNKGGLGFHFDAGFFRSFSPVFRLKAGLGVSYFSSTLEGNGEISAAGLQDIDNDSYTETLSLSNAVNEVNPVYLSVPVSFELGNLSINRTGFYIEGGITYSYLVYSNHQASGFYSAKGTYEQWGLVLENVQELGFYSGRNIQSNADFQKSNLSITGGVGITVPVSSEIILRFGVSGNIGLSDLGNNRPNQLQKEPVSNETFNFRIPYIDNTFAILKGTKTRLIGIDIGIYFNKQLK